MCPLCGSKGYTSFNSFECTKPACPNYKPSNTPVSGGPPSQGPQWEGRCSNVLYRFIARDGLLDVWLLETIGQSLVLIIVRFGNKPEDHLTWFFKKPDEWPVWARMTRDMLPEGHPAKATP